MKTNATQSYFGLSGSLQRLSGAVLLLMIAVLAGCDANGGRLVLSGTLETDDHDVVAPVTAQLLSLSVREGDAVASGDTVGILDTVVAAAAYRGAIAGEREAAARLADLEAGSDIEKIRAATAELTIARANFAQSERDHIRSDSLRTAGLIDTQTLEQAALLRDNAQASIKVADERLADLRRGARVHQIEAARAAWERTVADLASRRRTHEQLFLVAGHTGVVQWVPYQVGEYVPNGRTVATIHDPATLWAKVYMPEAHLDEVAPGDTVSFAVDAHPDRRFDGVVLLVSASSEFTPRNVQTPDERLNLVYAVKLAVAPGQDGLRAGMPADFFFE